MRVGAKAREAMLPAQNSKLARQLADVQKYVATAPTSLFQYRATIPGVWPSSFGLCSKNYTIWSTRNRGLTY